MPTPTYTPLANITLSSSATSVTFSSISQAYKDLIIVCNASFTTADTLQFQINSDTGSNYNVVLMRGDGSSTTAYSLPNNDRGYFYWWSSVATTSRVLGIGNFMDYSTTDKHKIVLTRGNDAASGVEGNAIRWANTSAITSIKVMGQSNNFASGSTFSLFGVIA